MCIKSYTHHLSCGCARFHATLPCPRAFDPSQPKCLPAGYSGYDQEEADCVDCKPSFDNKSCQAPEITSQLTPSPEPTSPRQPKIILHFTPKLKPAPEMRPKKIILRYNKKNRAHKGTLAQIEHEHNQFKSLSPEEREDAAATNFLRWIDHPDQPTESELRSLAHESNAAFGRCPSPSPCPSPSSTPCHAANVHHQRQLNSARRARKAYQRDHKMSPPPPPPPPLPAPERVTPPRVIKARVRDQYTLTARNHTLSASQRSAFERQGYGAVSSLSVVSRRHHCRT
ncbi:hypothetical protein diail_5376 [Diaporthe ilicicola]|nr:hypothetical protein diail_5376 [Diaporthe ilicicola]